ncbi:hypothetical protein EXIGLDRAFT_763988 [Exidia glandulosa HHB12029]|uniref:Uncharacterized protein n=1 Tax=Exidia glandulosa HHB12029 TaxID=1314781 RepID=A0A165LJV3_EXIGL|nr:hypothetical protein EXIGLDRAFT_763988 [Exidia glandulosa HHB12029]
MNVVIDGKAVAAFNAKPVKSRVGDTEVEVEEASARIKAVHGFYTDNEVVIKGAFDAFGSLVAGELSTKTTDAVLDVTKKVMGALDCVKQVHPFIQVAVLAFKVVIDFEIRRRENDKRVSALIVQGADMMIELFE